MLYTRCSLEACYARGSVDFDQAKVVTDRAPEPNIVGVPISMLVFYNILRDVPTVLLQAPRLFIGVRFYLLSKSLFLVASD